MLLVLVKGAHATIRKMGWRDGSRFLWVFWTKYVQCWFLVKRFTLRRWWNQ